MINTDYSLWKATRYMKRPRGYVPPIRLEDGLRALCEQDKADMYTHY